MDIRKILLTTVSLSAVTTFAGITTVRPGYEEWRWVVADTDDPDGWNHGLGRWSDGTMILMETNEQTKDQQANFARLDAQIAEGGFYFDTHVTSGKLTLTGYTLEEKGDFNYDGFQTATPGGDDGGYPIENRYDRWKSAYFKVQGKINVPTSGKWTFCIAASDMTLLRLTLSRGGVAAYDEVISPGWYNGHVIRVFDLEQGEYDLTFCQYTDNEKVYYEISTAAGEYTSFSKADFELVSVPFVTWPVTFDSDGGTDVATQTVRDGSVAVCPESPKKTGYAFVGWALDGQLYDFATPVTGALALTAVWVENSLPVVGSVTSSPEKVTINGATANFTLAVSATDLDANDTLTYHWSIDGSAPAACTIAAPDAATTEVTVIGSGTFNFKVEVSDGHETVSDTISVIVCPGADMAVCTFVGCESSPDDVGETNFVYELVEADWWDVKKTAWRSTNTVQKSCLLDDKRINAYGLDGYYFPSVCHKLDREGDVTSGTIFFDRESRVFAVSNVTEYVSSLEFCNVVQGWSPDDYYVEIRNINDKDGNACSYCIDDPREDIAGEVPDFRPGAVVVHVPGYDVVTPFATITFSRRISHYSKVRIGFLSSYNQEFKPADLYVGNAHASWIGDRTNGSGFRPDWMFFDIENVRAGGIVKLSLSTTKQQFNWKSGRIEGIVFDSVPSNNGFTISIR